MLQRDLRGAIDRYDQLKARAGALDFLDLLLLARDLVRDSASVRLGFQTRFKRIFVDEFQDTDPLQAEILLLLAADDNDETDWRKVRPRPGTLFLVGDPKQSIYRFRRADVGIYREVCDRLTALGATQLHLNTSFRSVPGIQVCVNRAFEPVMTGDPLTLQAPYVPLAPHRAALPNQPSVIALPVPEPYKWRYLSAAAIEQSLPVAVAAMTEWILRHSGWKVTERSGEPPVAVSAKHVCLLFRRFVSWQNDVTRPYVEALEARGIPHVLVGGRAFHEREEIEAIRAALAAIEWPDDELSVFATLRGPLFAIGDEALLQWVHHFGTSGDTGFRRYVLHPFRVPAVFAEDDTADDLSPCVRSPMRCCSSSGSIAGATTSPCRKRCTSCSARPARTSASRCAPAASRRWPTPSMSRSWHASSKPAAGSRFAASSRNCAWPLPTRSLPRRQFSKRTATACA